VAGIAVGLPISSLTVFAVLPPPVTPLMLIRLVEGEGLTKDWTSRERISPELFRAVIAAEDMRFCDHSGFDTEETGKAVKEWRKGRRLRGASTISMQTAKNLFLWPGRSLVRKVLEAYLTVWLELLWSKDRILEVYVNVAEWGPGVYGAEAAALAYFGKPAAELGPREASLLAAVLPNPRGWSPVRPSAYIRERAAVIRSRMGDVAVSTPEGICPDR